MKLIASLIVRNELGRYLKPCLESLLEFCDEIRILDDHSDEEGWPHSLNGLGANVVMKRTPRPLFFEHESNARNELLQWTFDGNPTHVLQVDADEFVTDGPRLRQLCEQDAGHGVWALELREIWKATPQHLYERVDGKWTAQGGRGISVLWRAPRGRVGRTGAWQLPNRQLACGRQPQAIRRLRPQPSGVDILHFGWANRQERAARHQRYVEHDGGRFHDIKHLDSIMLPDSQVRLRPRPWPTGLDVAAILEKANP
jgi:hypothetical protein